MRLLLDTHTLLWALADPERLSIRARSVLQASSNTVIVSAASAWEIATKHRLAIVGAYPAHLRTLRAEEMPIRAVHALLAGSLAAAHRDPFDRMLAAQAIGKGIPLVTDEPAFAAFADLETLW